MSKIFELIEKLCPDGVEYKEMGKILRIRNGKDYKKLPQGSNPVYGSGGIMTYVDGFIYDKVSVLIPRKGSLGKIYYVDKPFWVVDTIYYTEIDESLVKPKFLYYFLLKSKLEKYNQAGGVPSLTQNFLNKIKIPVPPLEVQEEIVRILDKFTLLEAELEAELEARKKQYIYYKSLAFSSIQSYEELVLDDICFRVSSGGTPRTSNKNYYGGDIPWVRTQEVDFCEIWDTDIKITEAGLSNSSAKIIPPNSVIVAMYGATAAKVAINKIPVSTNQACCNLQIDSTKSSYRYVFHWLSLNYGKLKSLGQGSQSNINARAVKSFPIILPNLEEQRRIVEFLDRFDALVNDISYGLPAEIAARRKQYEYYRDKLLTFKKL